MNPQEIAELEERQVLQARLGAANAEYQAWVEHHGRTTEAVAGAKERLEAIEAELAEHEAATATKED